MTGPDDAVEISAAELHTLSFKDLTARYEGLVGRPPPRLRRARLIRLIVAALERKAHPGLRRIERQVERRLHRLAEGRNLPPPRPALKPGVELYREWGGRTHTVTVTADGFSYEGSPYTSLSAIARAITGSAWSGPVFFGLDKS